MKIEEARKHILDWIEFATNPDARPFFDEPCTDEELLEAMRIATEVMSSESATTLKGWVARDSVEDAFSGCGLILHHAKPRRTGGEWSSQTIALHLPWKMFPELKWEDEPIEVELIIRPI